MKNALLLCFGTYAALNYFYGNTEQVNLGFATVPSQPIIDYAPFAALFLPFLGDSLPFIRDITKKFKKDDSLEQISDLEIKFYEDEPCRKACKTLRDAALQRLHS